MTTETSPGQVLMDVLDHMGEEVFRAQVDAQVRPDGIRPPLWEMQYKLEHAKPVRDPSPWLEELRHSLAHVLAAPSAEALRATLIQHAALTAAWIQDLDGRES